MSKSKKPNWVVRLKQHWVLVTSDRCRGSNGVTGGGDRRKGWWKEMLMSRCRRRPSLCLSLPELASFTWRCHGNPSLTPCEQSHRISPERQLKCQHCSRHCHVGLGEKAVGVVLVVVVVVLGDRGGSLITCCKVHMWWVIVRLCHHALDLCVSTTRLIETRAEIVAWRRSARLKWKCGDDMDLGRACKQSCEANYVGEKSLIALQSFAKSWQIPVFAWTAQGTKCQGFFSLSKTNFY